MNGFLLYNTITVSNKDVVPHVSSRCQTLSFLLYILPTYLIPHSRFVTNGLSLLVFIRIRYARAKNHQDYTKRHSLYHFLTLRICII